MWQPADQGNHHLADETNVMHQSSMHVSDQLMLVLLLLLAVLAYMLSAAWASVRVHITVLDKCTYQHTPYTPARLLILRFARGPSLSLLLLGP